ncbi:MAG: SprT family zinc-dependent metalloprotease [Verrucomicrobiota bacterium]
MTCITQAAPVTSLAAMPMVSPPIFSREIREELRAHLVQWCQLWQVPELPPQVLILFSVRLNCALGRCRPVRCRITLSDVLLLEPNRRLLVETLCHEAAHLAAFQKFGARIKPHGVEWRSLMQAAGYEPKVTARREQVFGLDQRLASIRRRYEYHCPQCNLTHLRRSKNIRLRCRACFNAGRSGLLLIKRLY